MVEPRERLHEFIVVQRLGQKFTVPGAHGTQQQVRIGSGRKSQDPDLVKKTLAQEFRRLQRKLRIRIEVHDHHTGLRIDRSLGQRRELR